MWKKGKTKIIQNSIVTYKHTHTKAHTHRDTLSRVLCYVYLSRPPSRHALCALNTPLSLSLSLVRERCNTGAQASVEESRNGAEHTHKHTHTHTHRAIA